MTSPVSIDAVQTAIEEMDRRRTGGMRRIAHLARRPSPYRTSFAIEEVDLAFEDGAIERLLFKDLSRRALTREARHAKPLFVFDPRREIVTYRTLLPSAPPGTARFYGAVVEPEEDRYWLFIERVHGRELYQIGEFDGWMRAARWLALFHGQFTGGIDALPPPFLASAIRYDANFLRRWPRRALARMRRDASITSTMLSTMERLVRRYEQVVEHLTSLPQTVLHGEYVASNVLIRDDTDGPDICPIDWEMVAIGPAPIDLAALVAGGWTEGEKESLALAYYESLDRLTYPVPGWDTFRTSLLYCRLHVAMQWLGWSDTWVPPVEHAFDWLGEALSLAERIGL